MQFFKYKYDRYLPIRDNLGFTEKKDFIKLLNVDFDNKNNAHNQKGGIPLYRGKDYTYIDTSEDHYIVIGSTASKKTRNVASPTIETLAMHNESMVITDPKGELYRRHGAGLKRKKYNVIVLNMKDMNADRWNPLERIYSLFHEGCKDEALMCIADIVEILSAPSRNCTKDVYWNLMAETGLTGYLSLMLYIFKQEEYTLNTLSELISEHNSDYVTEFLNYAPITSVAYHNIKNINALPEKTYTCVMSTIYSILKPFILSSRLNNMLSESNFDMCKIGTEPTAIFLVIPDNKSTMNSMISLFVSQLSQILIEQADRNVTGRLNIRVNYILDEFGNIATIPSFSNMIAAARSRNIRYMMIIQSFDQIENKYEDYKTIISNCSKIFLHSNEIKTLKEISDICGNKFIDGIEYPLISPTELQQLSKEKGETLILKNRCKPYMTNLTDIDDYSNFKFVFEDLPNKSMTNQKELSLKDVLSELRNGERKCYNEIINDIINMDLGKKFSKLFEDD